MLSQRQDFLNYHLAPVLFTPNQEGTMETRNEVLSSVGAQYMDTNVYQVTDLEETEFHWEDLDLNLDAIFRPGIDKTFSPSNFNDYERVSMTENPILIDKEQDKENSPPPTHPTTPVSENNPTHCVDEKLPLQNQN